MAAAGLKRNCKRKASRFSVASTLEKGKGVGREREMKEEKEVLGDRRQKGRGREERQTGLASVGSRGQLRSLSFRAELEVVPQAFLWANMLSGLAHASDLKLPHLSQQVLRAGKMTDMVCSQEELSDKPGFRKGPVPSTSSC